MNSKLTNFFKSTRCFLGKHSPEILTGVGVAGMITSTVLAVRATPKALTLIEDERNRQNGELRAEAISNGWENCSHIDKLKPLEVVKVAWKPYVPAVLTCVASASCIIGASAVNTKRNAALATAYAISERTLVKYRDKVIDTIGDKKEKEIREKIAQDKIDNKKVSESQVIITSKGNTLFMDGVSGRYFRSDLDKINKIINELNRRMNYENYISLDDFYNEIGLSSTNVSNYLGWNLDDGPIDLDIHTCLAENDEPCIVIDFTVAPRYEYDKLM